MWQMSNVDRFSEVCVQGCMLGARLRNEKPPGDELLLANGEWRKLMRIHRSEVGCILSSGSGSFPHCRQTVGRTSDAPRFAYRAREAGAEPTLCLVGVRSGGREAVESRVANNQAALRHGLYLFLDALLLSVP